MIRKYFLRRILKMEQRMDYYKIAPEMLKIMMEMEKYIGSTGIDPKLRELIKIRASQINGCAFCLNMHTADARKIGESEQRINCVSAWEECDFYTDTEKVALELTEHVTLIPEKRVPDKLYNRVRQFYGEKEYIDLIANIIQINSWNRISISMGNFATAVK
jgi:AhpD family alkylhydroperoxidase